MTRLTRTALREPWVTVLIALLLLIAGIAAVWSMNQELIPDIDFPQASVVAVWPGASAGQVTDDVVKPIESALDALDGVAVVEVSSTASDSFGAVTVRAEYGTTQDELRDAIDDSLIDLDLPDDVESIDTVLFNFSDLPVLLASASGNIELAELQDLIDSEVVPELESIDGVSQVSVSGTRPERVFVTLDSEKMAEAGITLDTVQNVFQANNLKFPAGSLEANGQTVPLQAGYLIRSLEELERLVVVPPRPAAQAAASMAAGPPSGAMPPGAPAAEESQTETEAEGDEARATADEDMVEQPEEGPYPLTPLLQSLGFMTTADLTPDLIRQLEENNPDLLRSLADDVIASLPPGAIDELDPEVIEALPDDLRAELVEAVGTPSTAEAEEEAEAVVRMRAVIVEADDTVDSIAERFGIDPGDIRDANDLTDDALTPGDVIRVPVPTGGDYLSPAWRVYGARSPSDISPEILRRALAEDPESVSDLTGEQLVNLPPETIAQLPEALIARQGPDTEDELRRSMASASAPTEAAPTPAPTTAPTAVPTSVQAAQLEMLPAVALGDIATVERGLEDIRTISRTDLEPALSLLVAKEQSANTVAVADEVIDKLADLEKEDSLKSVEFNIVFEQGSYITESLDGVIREGLLGALFAVIAILIFLNFSLRATLVTAISIPLSVFVGFLLMRMTGLTLNLLTLSGMTVAIGRVVDDSIVVLENIYRHIQRGERRKDAIIEGTREVATAITSSTLVAVAVFLPLGFLGGLTSEFFLPFGLTVTYALGASLVVAVTVVPVFSRLFLSQAKLPEDKETWLQRLYTPSLEWSLDHRLVTLVLALLFFVASLGLVRFIPQTFLPTFGEPQIGVDVALNPGTSLEVTDQVAMEIERLLTEDEDIGAVQSTVGSSGGGETFFLGTTGGNSARATISAALDEDFEGEVNELTDRIRDEVEAIDFGRPVTLTVSSAAGGGPVSSFYDLQIRSEDQGLLRDANDRVLAALEDEDNWEDYDEVPIINLSSNLTAARSVVAVQVDPARALEKGLTAAQVAFALRQVLEGQELGDIVIESVEEAEEGAEAGAITVVARFPADAIESVDDIEDHLIAGPAGPVRLGDVAEVTSSPGPVTITRVDGERAALITGEMTDEDTFGVIADAEAIIDDLELDDTIEVGPGIETSTQQEGFEETVLALPVSILIVYLIMAITFGSLVHPFTILFSLPFAVTGALIALAATGRPLSISSLIGMLMLVGIVVANAIVLVDLVQQYRARGMDCRTALVRGGRTRLRPILMTAVATVLALFPMALGFTEGAIIAAELATVVIGGLVTSTLLTLIVVPVIYSLLDPITGRPRGPGSTDVPPEPPSAGTGGPGTGGSRGPGDAPTPPETPVPPPAPGATGDQVPPPVPQAP